MKTVIDPTVSKRPMTVYDDGDTAKMTLIIEDRTREINELDARIASLKTSPTYLKTVLRSRQRMVDIAFTVMELPPDDVKAISRAQGSFFERKLLTCELANLEEQKKDKVSFVERLIEQLHKISDKIKKMKEGRK